MSLLATLSLPSSERVISTDHHAPVTTSGEVLFDTLYRTRYRDVFRYALLMTRSGDEAEDMTADTFQRAYAAITSGHGPSAEPLPWLLLICRRVVLNHRRRSRLISWLPLGVLPRSKEPTAHDPGMGSEFWEWFAALSEVLPERQREVLILRYRRDLDDDQIGSILGLTASGVRSLVARALASLRTHPELWK